MYQNEDLTEIEVQENIDHYDNVISTLDLLINIKLNEISDKDNFKVILKTFDVYLPQQFFNMSSTKERFNRIFDLSDYEYSKLIILYKMAVLNADFNNLYELEPEHNEHEIAEKILEFDMEYWNCQTTYKDLYQNLIQTFSQTYSQERVSFLLEQV